MLEKGLLLQVRKHLFNDLTNIDTGRGANWAVGGRPFSRRRGVCIVDGSDDPDVFVTLTVPALSSGFMG